MSTSKNTNKAAAMNGAQDMNSKAGKASAGRASSVKANGGKASARPAAPTMEIKDAAQILAEMRASRRVVQREGQDGNGRLRTLGENRATALRIRAERADRHMAEKLAGTYVPFDVEEFARTPDFRKPGRTYELSELSVTVRVAPSRFVGVDPSTGFGKETRFSDLCVRVVYPKGRGQKDEDRLVKTGRFHISKGSALHGMNGLVYDSSWEGVPFVGWGVEAFRPKDISLTKSRRLVDDVSRETGEVVGRTEYVNVWAGLRSDRRDRAPFCI